MPRAKFRCKRCKRSFSMAAHLARHNNTIHGSKKKKKTANAKASKKKAERSTAQPEVVRTVAASRAKTGPIRASSAGASGSKRIVDLMRDHHRQLLGQHRSLDAQLDAIVRAMEAVGAATPSGGTQRAAKKRGRPIGTAGRRGSLKSYIVRVLRQRSTPIGLKDIGTRVKKAGYKTKSKNLTGAVSKAIRGLKGVKRVSHGKYKMVG